MPRGIKAEIGDTRWSPNGYHYTNTPRGWVLTHRLMIEIQLGRKLERDERVVFIDNDRRNIKLENLRLTKVHQSTKARKKAVLEAKVEELLAAIEELS